MNLTPAPKDTNVITVAKDFSRAPAGRLKTDGPKSGELFRVNLLVPSLKKSAHVLVRFDGVEGVGSSFLEEAFGGLIRVEGFREQDLRNRLDLISDEEPVLIDEVWGYIRDAEKIAQS